jgi:ABC-type multidrug transport system fused ATPase/permease subunit
MREAEISVGKRLLSLFSERERVHVLALVVMTAGGAALEVIGIGMVVPLVAALTNPDSLITHPTLRSVYQWTGAQSPERFAILLLGGFLGLILFKNGYLALVAYLQARFVFGKQARLSRRMFDGYIMAPYTLHLERHSADVIRNLATEVNNLFTGLVAPLLVLGAEAMVLLLLVAVLLFAMPLATFSILFLGGAIVIGVYAFLRSVLGRYGAERALRSGKRIRAISDALGGLKEIKVLGREAFFTGAFGAANGRYLETSRIFSTLNVLPRLLIEALAVAILVAVISVLVLSGERDFGAAVPGIVLLCLVALRLMPAATRILAAVSSIRFYLPALDHVHRDLTTLESHLQRAQPSGTESACIRLVRSVEVEDVVFSYPGASHPALDGIALSIPIGQMSAFVGPSGAGKSTLADLILGVYEPRRGRILVDGIDIRSVLPAWRRCVGYVPQTVHLLDDSVRRNIAYGLPDAEIDDRQVWQALQVAQIEGLVRSLPGKLDDKIGEQGMRLSGGQRQRLGIARALYSDPQVLILDEATSALDRQTERAIADTLLDMRRARTVIVIAHRLDTIKRCDRLFFLAEGRLQGTGSYDELVSGNARFAALVGEATL